MDARKILPYCKCSKNISYPMLWVFEKLANLSTGFSLCELFFIFLIEKKKKNPVKL